MGNKCSTKTLNPLFDETNLNDYDREIFNLKREKVFYGTIAICVLYGSFAFLLFILSLFSDKIKYLLLNSFLPFTIVYIIGTILIIMYLIVQVLNFKPYKINKDGNYENLSCPDYWTLEYINVDNSNETEKRVYDSNFENKKYNNNLFRYRCKLNSNIFNTYDIFKASSNIDNANNYKGRYHFFNTGSNININEYNKKLDILPDYAVINNHDSDGFYPNMLYTNVYNNDSNTIKTKIFKNNQKYMYELNKAALLMNNYSILNDADNENTGPLGNAPSTKFYRKFDKSQYNSGTFQPILKKFDINNLEFNFTHNTTNSPSDVEGTYNNLSHIIDNDTDVIELKEDTSARVYTVSSKPILDNRKTAFLAATTTKPPARNIPLNCEVVYPELLASIDKKINEQDRNMDTNVMRCAYSKLCGVPWSDINCDKYDD